MQLNDISRAVSALNALDPGCGRAEWFEILCAAKAAGVSFEDADAWSSSGSNYKDRRDVKYTWDTIKDGGITERTLFDRALKNGWSDTDSNHPERLHQIQLAPTRPVRPAHPPKKPRYNVQEVWHQCTPADDAHGYIARKHGIADGLGVYPDNATRVVIGGQNIAGWLAVPCRTPTGKLQSLQFIPAEKGKKLNFPGAPVTGGMHVVGELQPDGSAYVAEGISAAWVAWKATGRAAVVAFGWGNIKTIAPVLRERYPALELVLLPDVGKEQSAAEIAASVSHCGWVALPDGMEQNADVGDYAEAQGVDMLEDLLANGVKYPPKHEPRYRALSAVDLLKLPPILWRVRDVLPMSGIAAVFGPSGSGKSFITIDLAAALALGLPDWFGYKLKPCKVAYVALEGAQGLRNRVAAWELRNSTPAPTGLHFIVPNDFNLMNPKDARELAHCILETAGPGCLTVIDTLAQACPGMDENSGADMSLALRGAKTIQAATGGLVVLVHHSGKDTAKGMRGHSSLRAALDAAIEVSRDGECREWKVEKSKDGADGQVSPFRLRVVDLGIDDDGEQVTSCVVVRDVAQMDTTERVKLPQRGTNTRTVYDALDGLLSTCKVNALDGVPNDRPSARMEDLIEKCRPLLTCKNRLVRQYVQKALNIMRAGGVIGFFDGYLWLENFTKPKAVTQVTEVI